MTGVLNRRAFRADVEHELRKKQPGIFLFIDVDNFKWRPLSDKLCTDNAGGVIFPEQGEDFVSLCKNADAVLYDIKQNGKAAFKMK